MKEINFSEMKSLNFHLGRIFEIVTLIVYVPVRLEMMFWVILFFCPIEQSKVRKKSPSKNLSVFILNCKENSEEFIFSGKSLTILFNTSQWYGFSFPRKGLSRIMLGR